MFAIVKCGKSSLFIDGLESHYYIQSLSQCKGGADEDFQATFQFSSKHRSLAGLKAIVISSLQALLRGQVGKYLFRRVP